MSPGLSQGCGTRRFTTLIAAEKAVDRGADGTPQECTRGGLAHWHLSVPAAPYIPPAVRRLCLKRDNWCCVCCGRSIVGEHYSLGHRQRSGQLGGAVPQNLITLLGLGGEAHHGRIDLYKDPDDAAKGYRLTSRQDPLLVPVEYATPDGPVSYFLLPDGGRRRVESEAAA
jgi:hypothetical protein